MTEEGTPDISRLLDDWNNGDQKALTDLMPHVYPELRRIARQHLANRPAGHTLESAGVANEAYLKLIRAGRIQCQNRIHFLAICTQIIRRILVDHARSRGYAKRGGNAVRVSLEGLQLEAPTSGVDVLALDEALVSLSKFDERKARVVELRYFGGLTVQETAEVLGISSETAKRDWKIAKAWLFGELISKAESTSIPDEVR